MQFLPQDQLQAFLGHLAGRAAVVAPVADAGRRALPSLVSPVIDGRAGRAAGQAVGQGVRLPSDRDLPDATGTSWRAPRSVEETMPDTAHGEAATVEAADGKVPAARQGPPGPDARPAERSGRAGHLRPASVRRPRLRPDGQRLRRLRRLLLRPAVQRQARGDHAARRHVRPPALHVLLHGGGRRPGRHRGCRRALHPGGGRLHRRGADPQGRGGAGLRRLDGGRRSRQTDAAAAVKTAATGTRRSRPFDGTSVAENLRANLEDPAWHDLAMRCISCGTCTYVCPNCYCFNINDEMVEGKGERFRTWDNCFNPSYTLETSGHNPRDAQGQAVPQPLQPQVLVLPREVRQPALLGLRALRHALPHPHRHPRGAWAPWACRGRRRRPSTAGEGA